MGELRRILHVDDEPDIREIVRMSLAMVGGFEVCQCASGLEALAAVEGMRPDLILLDVMMPVMDGEETLRRLRRLEAVAETPIVFMTAKAFEKDYNRLIELGAVDVLVKPFDPMALPDQIRVIWDRFVG